eukprot:6843043-Pyramimonas_sp.AAC.1
MIRSCLGLFSLDGSDDESEDDSSEDGELVEGQCSWVADFVLAFLRCIALQRDRFVEAWAEPLSCGSFPSLCQNLCSIADAEWIPDVILRGAEELVDLVFDVVQPMWDAVARR